MTSLVAVGELQPPRLLDEVEDADWERATAFVRKRRGGFSRCFRHMNERHLSVSGFVTQALSVCLPVLSFSQYSMKFTSRSACDSLRATWLVNRKPQLKLCCSHRSGRIRHRQNVVERIEQRGVVALLGVQDKVHSVP